MNEKHELQMLPETSGRLPKSVEEFERNYEREHPGSTGCFHNIYHLVSEDRDGNITGEAFGLNITTDYGFANMYKCSNSSEQYISRMYLGDGAFETIDYASSSMVHAISSTSGTFISGSSFNPSHVNTKWIPEKESNRVTIKLCECYFDYTVWPEDHTVTEIGLSSAVYTGINQLKYHAAIYDSEGHKSSFVKHVNEKLTINVYGRWMVPIVKIINQSWDNGIPAVIRSVGLWQEAYGTNWYTMTITLYPYNTQNGWGVYDYFKYYNTGSITNHVYSTDITQSMNVFIDGKQQYVSERVFNSGWSESGKYIQHGSYFLFVSKLYAPEPIPFQQDFFRWLGYNYGTLEKTYCWRSENSVKDPTGQLPMTNIHITSLTMYNGQTDDWDIDVPYTEPISYLEHGYQHLRFCIREQNWITFLDDYKWYTVFINEAPQYPISKIHSCDRTMYVTDAYWDSSTWEIVPNTNNISRAQGGKRFFIMFDETFSAWVSDYDVGYYASSDYARLVSRYDYNDKFPVINTNNGSWEDHAVLGKYFNDWTEVEYYYGSCTAGKAINNETYNYIAQSGILVYPESIDPNPTRSGWDGASYDGNLSGVPYRYTIGGINLNGDFPTGRHLDGAHPNFIWNTTRGGHIICAGNYSNNAGCRVYTISTDPSQAPTYDDFIYDAAWNKNPGWTHTDNGYLVVSYISGNTNVNETYVFAYDVPNETPSMYKVTGYHHGFAIDLTDYFVAIDANVTDHLHMVIYDMANQTVHDEFDIPAGYTFQGIAAWKNFIYIRVDQSGAKSTYVYYIQQQMLESTPLDLDIMIFDTDSYEYHIQRAVEGSGNIESCMILFASGKYEHQSKTHMLFKESDPTHPEEIIFKENLETSSYVRWQKAWLGYTADKKQLICCYAGRRCISLDISWNLKHGAQTNYRSWGSYYQSDSNRYSPIYHKGYCYLLRLCWNSDTYDTSHGWDQHPTISDFYRYPYQQWMSMRIIGTTYTPNSMMNPVRIQGNIGRSWFSSTNRDVDAAPPHYGPTIYGFHVNPSESNPSNAVTYLEMAVGKTPAQMGSTTFSYGSWEDAFFMPRPCMLNNDGTVAYYLDPNDYTKKEDGVTPSDIDDPTFAGNAMMEWPKIYWKYVAGETDGEGSFYCSNQQVDSSYHCWCNYDCDGNEIPHFYTAIYRGVTQSNVTRSISGLQCNSPGKDLFDEWAYCTANNTDANKEEWGGAVYPDRILITGLLILMAKSLDSQSAYGNGFHVTTTSGESYAGITVGQSQYTGTLDDKGLFYGNTIDGTSHVKVFGMEDFWGYTPIRVFGAWLIASSQSVSKLSYKLTYSTIDGSSGTGWTNWSKFSAGSVNLPANYNNEGGAGERVFFGWVNKLVFDTNGMTPRDIGFEYGSTGGPTMYEGDGYYQMSWGSSNMWLVGAVYRELARNDGGPHTDYRTSGLFATTLVSRSPASWFYGTTLSCKPLLSKFPQT